MDQPRPAAVQNDPLFRLAFFDGRDHRWLVIVLSAAATAIVMIVRPGLWLLEVPVELSGERTFAALVWALIGIPVGLYVYFWLPGSLASLVPELRQRRLLDVGPAEITALDTVETEIDERMGTPWFPIAGLVVVVGYALYRLVDDRPVGTAAALQFALEVLANSLAAFVGTVIIGRLVSGLAATRAFLARFRARVQPLHGDDAGGWSPLGQRAYVLARAAALYGFVAIVINTVGLRRGLNPLESPESVATVVGFVIFAPLVVWAWLFAPHRAMKEARSRALAEVSNAFAAGASAPVPALAHAEQLRLATDYLAELARRRDIVASAYPVWPMRTAELRGLWAVALSPLLASGLQIAADLVRKAVIPAGS